MIAKEGRLSLCSNPTSNQTTLNICIDEPIAYFKWSETELCWRLYSVRDRLSELDEDEFIDLSKLIDKAYELLDPKITTYEKYSDDWRIELYPLTGKTILVELAKNVSSGTFLVPLAVFDYKDSCYQIIFWEDRAGRLTRELWKKLGAVIKKFYSGGYYENL